MIFSFSLSLKSISSFFSLWEERDLLTPLKEQWRKVTQNQSGCPWQRIIPCGQCPLIFYTWRKHWCFCHTEVWMAPYHMLKSQTPIPQREEVVPTEWPHPYACVNASIKRIFWLLVPFCLLPHKESRVPSPDADLLILNSSASRIVRHEFLFYVASHIQVFWDISTK